MGICVGFGAEENSVLVLEGKELMIYSHKLEDAKIELTDAILGHSADESVIYKTVEGEPIYLGYFFPKDYERKKKYPTFLFIHGGGWASHKIFEEQPHWQGDYLGFLARYYADKGFLGVSIDYRLIKDSGQMPGYGLIESYEDCCDAVDYVLAHAKQYGVDQENMYLLGESSGGHLAGAVATFHYDRCYSFKKVFLINAITDLNDRVWNKTVPRESVHEKLSCLSFEERTKFLSPLYQLDERLGEVVLIHGKSDSVVSSEHSEKFYHRLHLLSKKCELHMIENTNHAFLLAEYTRELCACRLGIQIIDNSLIKSYVCKDSN